jgi:hypothetical protein
LSRDAEPDAISALLDLLDRSGLDYAVIGGHAVNAWLEPRFTADLDVTLQADPDAMARLKELLATRGYRVTREYGADLPSGPDFVRFVSDREGLPLEVKLIAGRPKDEIDLLGLVRLDDLDWPYIERRAAEWEVIDRLRVARSAAARS